MFLSISKFPLTIAPLAICIFLTRHYRITFNNTKSLLLFFVIFWPIFIFLIYSLFIKTIEITEFATTYLLWLFGSVAVVLGSISHIKKFERYSSVYIVALFLVVSFSIFQVLALRVFDIEALYNPFGEFTYLSQYSLDRVYSLTGPRAYGLFLEPSYNSFIMFFLMSIILMDDRSNFRIFVYVIGALGIVFTASASGILLTFILLFLIFWLTAIKNNILRLVLLFLVPIALVSMIPEELMVRLNEVNLEGTSGYWRLVAPIKIIYEAMLVLPLGIPFGQVNDFVYNLGIDHGGEKGTSLDNGFAILFFYFGLFAFIFLAAIVYKLLVSIYFRNYKGVIFWWFIFASLQFSGGIFLPEFIFPILLILYQYKLVNFNEMPDVPFSGIKKYIS
ncbi:hypothetical protein [Rheinheimera soli]|uniref:Colanic acid polymerase n=1 Tax=Rheinheimera soli TaxID=443616 RepID=A0ABU1VUC1_9GAMM|nr:hypothetical protein [Rheinheimera soli]MDR7119277.1 putative colanic acid polymerase [Rheinheimera soli]